ncbi:uncharacterized protein I303_101413 [Kwoniella dejecticola CBS 10117]|uniref:Sugar phosphate transporter domain-containing protein n=1 Tax=Kwoniella dejecticola CBS 10117 TaxID=1296121 RepID=A0A1A6AHV1_9TREE|nr:uncharacterized protein I303_01422 [Kwoniella dejecticola CBS 10117]OBR89593.1 hypothetical protein I303_01422 [Kwoniella dejecticola CBS 10117]
MSHQPTYLAPTAQQPLNKYIPQSPQPDSPPQTPSPISPGKSTLALSEQAMVELDTQQRQSIDNRPIGTPEGYSYNSGNTSGIALVRSDSHTSSTSIGIGINFPANSNPLPRELHSPSLTANGNGNIALPPVPVQMQRRKSSDGSIAIPFPTTDSSSASAGMSHSLSAGSTSSPQPQQQNLSPFPPTTSAQFGNTPPRPRTVSPRHNTNTSGTFASSSALGKSSLGYEPRERVLSPHKSDGSANNGVFHSSGSNEDLTHHNHNHNHNHNSIDPNNPYDSHGHGHAHANGGKEKQNWQNANTSFATFGGVGSQPYFPLTGKENLLGNSPTVHPKKVPFTDSVAFWLGLYFCFNLGLTLFNKFVLVSFPFPYTLTGLHALSGCAGTYIALEQGAFTPARLTQKENVILAAFSVLYTINIAVSNISLQLVSIPFHQVVRASTPLFTIFIAAIFLRARFSMLKLVSLLPVVAGVGFATYGDYDFTALGLILTLLGTFLAALKTVVTNLIQTGGGGRLKLHPLDLLMRMSPLAFIQCVIYGWYTGELERVRRYGATQMTRSKAIALLCNGVFAFGLNIVSFTANKKAGALTMTVSANCKQVLTIVLAVMLFNLHISPTNGVGILLTLVGGGWYGYVEYIEKKKKTKVLERA